MRHAPSTALMHKARQKSIAGAKQLLLACNTRESAVHLASTQGKTRAYSFTVRIVVIAKLGPTASERLSTYLHSITDTSKRQSIRLAASSYRSSCSTRECI